MDPEITGDLRVAQVLRRWPDTGEVFRRFGCPDMRRGFFALMARIMRLRWAARVHRIPIDELLEALNATAQQRTNQSLGTTGMPCSSRLSMSPARRRNKAL